MPGFQSIFLTLLRWLFGCTEGFYEALREFRKSVLQYVIFLEDGQMISSQQSNETPEMEVGLRVDVSHKPRQAIQGLAYGPLLIFNIVLVKDQPWIKLDVKRRWGKLCTAV